jgi:hypothetical protein
MVRLLREWNAQAFPSSSSSTPQEHTAYRDALVTLDEVPGQQHWWWDTRSANDGGAMHDATMRAFWRRCLGGAKGLGATLPPLPLRFELRAFSVNSVESRGGLFIAELRRSMQLASIRVHRDEAQGVWHLRTRNVARIGLRVVASLMTIDLLPAKGFIIDGQHHSPVSRDDLELILLRPGLRSLCRRYSGSGGLHGDDGGEEGSWTACFNEEAISQLVTHIPRSQAGFAGPMRQVYVRPFLFVVGTGAHARPSGGVAASSGIFRQEDPTLADAHLKLATFVAGLHVMAAETHVRVVRDVDLLTAVRYPNNRRTSSAIKGDALRALNPNLILIGGPRSNAYARAMAEQRVRWRASSPGFFLANERALAAGRNESAEQAGEVVYAIPGAPANCNYSSIMDPFSAQTRRDLGALFLEPLLRMGFMSITDYDKEDDAVQANADMDECTDCEEEEADEEQADIDATNGDNCPPSSLPAAADAADDDACSAPPVAGLPPPPAPPLPSPSNLNALALVLDGGPSSPSALRVLARLAEPSIPPMVRAPFTNLGAPDYLLFDAQQTLWRGWGGIIAAGYFDAKWRHQPVRAYDTC